VRPPSCDSGLRTAPAWLTVCVVQAAPSPALASLDAGEREAIQLARDTQADALLMDEKRGSTLARREGFLAIGTIDILVRSAGYGLVDLDMALARLQKTNFRGTPRLREARRRLREKS
jgi:uncharacterized protein